MNMRLRRWFVACLTATVAMGVDEVSPSLTTADVLALVRAGFSEPVVAHAIEAQAGPFDVSATALAELKKAGVGQRIIAAVQRLHDGPPRHLRLLDPGVYYKRDDAYALLPPEEAEWRGTVSVADGFERVRLIGQVDNTTSKIPISIRSELLIVSPPGHSGGAFQLLRADPKRSWREFNAEAAVRAGKLVGMADAQDAATTVEFDQKFDLGVRIPLRPLRPGEYGLVPPDVVVNGRVSPKTRIFTFTIL